MAKLETTVYGDFDEILKTLYDQRLITKEEYDEKRKELLDRF